VTGAPAAPASTGAAKSPAAAGVAPQADTAQLIAGMADVRSLLQRSGAALGTAGTAIVTGLGFTQLHQFFPVPRSISWVWSALAVVALILAVAGSAWLAGIFLYAQRRILIGTRHEDTIDLGKSELKRVNRIYLEQAHHESARNLHELERRSLRLDRIAARMKISGDPRADRVQAESDRLYELVTMALYRAAATVLEHRSQQAFSGWRTRAAFACAAVGIAATFGFADYFKSVRDLGGLTATCVQAEAQGAANACAPFESKSELQTARVQAAAAAAAKAVTTLRAQSALSREQRRIVARFAECSTAVAGLPPATSLSPTAKQQAVALCATAG
jgi:hypothetical protein